MAAPNELSFLPDDYLERKARRRTNAICAGLFTVVLCGLGGTFTMQEKSNREIDKQYGDVVQQFTDAAKKIEQVQQMQEKQRTMAHQAELTAGLLEKVPRSYLLAEITNDMPPGVSLLDFALEAKVSTTVNSPAAKTAFDQRKAELEAANGGTKSLAAMAAAATKPRIYDVTMRATGIATTDVQVAQFISKLNKSELLSEVNLVISDEFMQDNHKLRRFQIEMTLDPTAHVGADAAPRKLKGSSSTAALPVETPSK
jgi:Tfp pilus assembly protein PilN